jgi:signal transduction histidine kinase
MVFFKPEADKKGLELKRCSNLPGKMGVIYTDRNKILSVLTNLIKNALKFTSEGFVEFGSGFCGNDLCLYVRDSGIGIPDDKLDAIFERFVQADMAYSKGYEGSGLGLSIAKSYIEALGGTISVKSQVGEGTIFWVTMEYNPAENGNGRDMERTWPACPCQSGASHRS